MTSKLYFDAKADEAQMSLFRRARRSPTGALVVSSLAIFSDMLIFGVVIPILPALVGRFTKPTDSRQTILFAAYAIGLFIATPIFGVVSDRYRNRRVPMLIGLAGLAGCTLLFAVATSYVQLVLARFLQCRRRLDLGRGLCHAGGCLPH